MKLAVMQPYLYPYLGYFQLIHVVDCFVVYDDVNYIKRGWVNRNNLLEGGEGRLFTVPLIDASQNRKFNEVMVSDEGSWREKFLRRLELLYRKAPMYAAVAPLVERGIRREGLDIGSYARCAIEDVMAYLSMDTRLVPSSTVYGNKDLKGTARIMDICKREGASHYINTIGGKELYDKEQFREQGMEMSFIRSLLPPYPQGGAPFVPALSIIDVLMFNEPEQVRGLLEAYELL